MGLGCEFRRLPLLSICKVFEKFRNAEVKWACQVAMVGRKP